MLLSLQQERFRSSAESGGGAAAQSANMPKGDAGSGAPAQSIAGQADDGHTIISALASGKADVVPNSVGNGTSAAGETDSGDKDATGDGHSLINALAAGQLGAGTAVTTGSAALLSRGEFAAALLRAVQDPAVVDRAYKEYEAYFVRTADAAKAAAEAAAAAAETAAAAEAMAAKAAAAEEEAAALQREAERIAREEEKRKREAQRVEAIMAAADALAAPVKAPVQEEQQVPISNAFDALVNGRVPTTSKCSADGDAQSPALSAPQSDTGALSAFDALVQGRAPTTSAGVGEHDWLSAHIPPPSTAGALSAFDALVQGQLEVQTLPDSDAVGGSSTGDAFLAMIQATQPAALQTARTSTIDLATLFGGGSASSGS
eukprot:SAG31_NODE_3552_length_4131_cov_2.172123_3_plen_375_part_00